jgi:hypothetical protein
MTHTHAHAHEPKAMGDAEKLPILLEHWIEHNASHAAEFAKWAERAQTAGLDEVAGDITAATESLGEATTRLQAALTRLRPDA